VTEQTHNDDETATDTIDTDTIEPHDEPSDVAESNDAAPLPKLKGENKRLRHRINDEKARADRWEASASTAWQMVAESILASELQVADPAALLARLKPVHEYVDSETHALDRDELVADAGEFMNAIRPRRRRDPDQGKGNGRMDDKGSFGTQMRQGMRGA
jgi:hypothetical protein